jgi:micrococcal nuclease
MKALVAVALVLVSSTSPYVVDGDTLAFGRERVRIANLDAPDVGIHARCALEQRRGEGAKSYAQGLIRNASLIEIVHRNGLDRFGRTLARVQVDGRDFAGLMIAAGYGRPWRGRSSDWCKG